MPNYSGSWTRTQQLQATAAGTWTGLPVSSVELLIVAGGGGGGNSSNGGNGGGGAGGLPFLLHLLTP